jgi:hypothetical protein
MAIAVANDRSGSSWSAGARGVTASRVRTSGTVARAIRCPSCRPGGTFSAQRHGRARDPLHQGVDFRQGALAGGATPVVGAIVAGEDPADLIDQCRFDIPLPQSGGNRAASQRVGIEAEPVC